MKYSCGPLHMDEQKWDVALKTYRERWTIETGGGRGSGTSVLVARHDDDDDFYIKFIILFNINRLFALSEVVTSFANQHHLFDSTLFIHLYTVKWFQLIPIIHFWYIFKEFQVFLCITNNSIKHPSFCNIIAEGFFYIIIFRFIYLAFRFS